MYDFLNLNYEWFRALHIISFISWMAGMLYLPRLFIYHTMADIGSDMSEKFKIMEHRLFKFIMNPAMTATWIFGSIMLYLNWDYFKLEPWMHIKFLSVLIMTAIHHNYLKHLRAFASDNNKKSEKYFRILNEIPTIMMIIIVIMAVIEPF